MWRLIGGGLGVLALAALILWNQGRTYRAGFEAGAREQAAAIERWRTAVLEQTERRRLAELERWIQAQEVIDELRARPAEIRERIRTITVAADDRCESLPVDFRRLWNADAALAPAPGVPGSRPPAAGAGLGDEAATRMAAAFR